VVDKILRAVLEDIKVGANPTFFATIEDLHIRVEADLKRDIDCIKRYRETREYFKFNRRTSYGHY